MTGTVTVTATVTAAATAMGWRWGGDGGGDGNGDSDGDCGGDGDGTATAVTTADDGHCGRTFHAVVAAVHVVAQEEEVGRGTVARDPKEFEQVVELAVNVTHHRHRRRHSVHVLLFG